MDTARETPLAAEYIEEPHFEVSVKEEPLEEEQERQDEIVVCFGKHQAKEKTLEKNEETTNKDVSKPGDPLEPTLRYQHLESQTRLVILNVYKYMKKYKLIQARVLGKDMNVLKTTAEATGASETTVKKIAARYRDEGIERAIRPPSKTRRRKTDVLFECDKDGKLKKNQEQEKPN